MEEPMLTGGGYKLLKALLVILIIAGVVFLWKFAGKRIPPDIDQHRGQLEMLEEAYRLRQANLQDYYEEKIKTAPNEILSVKYQQDLSQALRQAQENYFADKRAILKGEYGVLKAHWEEEIREIKYEAGEK